MQSRFIRSLLVVVAVLLIATLGVIEGNAQTRRKRRSRRHAKPAAARTVVTNPTISPAGSEESGDAKIISTAEDSSGSTDQGEAATAKKKNPTDPEDMQRTINSLSNQVDKLNNKLSQMQENDRTMLDMERLTRAEQRAENLRTQQLDTETKLADVQARLDQIEFAVKPENIERETAGYGSTHPEETREARRRQLEAERSRLQAQVRLLETNRSRLETAVANADAEVDLLRRRLESQRQQPDNAQNQTDTPAKNPKKPD
ncbi:MAG TPA: hypothetical protein VIV66_06710 [Pyrinomonadaceae bacterium]